MRPTVVLIHPCFRSARRRITRSLITFYAGSPPRYPTTSPSGALTRRRLASLFSARAASQIPQSIDAGSRILAHRSREVGPCFDLGFDAATKRDVL